MTIVIAIGLFISVALLIEGCFLAYKALFSPEAKRIKRRIRTTVEKKLQLEEVNIVRNQVLSEIPSFNTWLRQASLAGSIARLLEQAHSQTSVGIFVLWSALLAGAGFAACSALNLSALVTLGVTGLGGVIPTVFFRRKKMQRLWRFEKQLPDALDLIGRAMRAGHTLMIGMQMVGEEFSEPIGEEFEWTVQELSLGVSVPRAFNNLCRRIESQELKFFVTALIIQWEIGGSLTEILDVISHLIRGRFELLGRIKAISAEGRLSAVILFALPPVLGFVIFLVQPTYLLTLVTDPVGRVLLAGGAILMVLGGLITKKMVNIEV